MDRTLTVTLHLWWLWAYLAVGAVLWLPLEYMAWRSIASPREPFWRMLRTITRRRWYVPFTTVALWPLAVWEEVRLSEGNLVAQAERADCCTGDYGCNVLLHVHGCYSDRGNCDAPEEHAVAGPGHVVDIPVSASEPNPPKAGR